MHKSNSSPPFTDLDGGVGAEVGGGEIGTITAAADVEVLEGSLIADDSDSVAIMNIQLLAPANGRPTPDEVEQIVNENGNNGSPHLRIDLSPQASHNWSPSRHLGLLRERLAAAAKQIWLVGYNYMIIMPRMESEGAPGQEASDEAPTLSAQQVEPLLCDLRSHLPVMEQVELLISWVQQLPTGVQEDFQGRMQDSAPLRGRNRRLDRAFQAIKDKLRANWRVSQPTKQEQILEVLERHSGGVVSIAELTPLFEGTFDPEQSARDAIVRLNVRLEPYGFRISHVPAYCVTSIDHPA